MLVKLDVKDNKLGRTKLGRTMILKLISPLLQQIEK